MKKNITAVIPCFNAQNTIERAVLSIIKQSTPVDEIIILDDLSTDSTLDILHELQKKYPLISIITHDKNHGPSYLRNKGIDLAKNPFVAFLDADDYWHPEKISIFQKDPDVPLWGSLYTIHPDSNSVIKNHSKTISFHQQLLKNHVTSQTVIINKNIIQDRFDETMRYCEDYEYFTRIAFKHGIYLNQSVLCTIHKHQGLSSRLFKMRMGEIKMYFKATSYCRPLFLLLPLLISFSLCKHLFLLTRINILKK